MFFCGITLPEERELQFHCLTWAQDSKRYGIHGTEFKLTFRDVVLLALPSLVLPKHADIYTYLHRRIELALLECTALGANRTRCKSKTTLTYSTQPFVFFLLLGRAWFQDWISKLPPFFFLFSYAISCLSRGGNLRQTSNRTSV